MNFFNREDTFKAYFHGDISLKLNNNYRAVVSDLNTNHLAKKAWCTCDYCQLYENKNAESC